MNLKIKKFDVVLLSNKQLNININKSELWNAKRYCIVLNNHFIDGHIYVINTTTKHKINFEQMEVQSIGFDTYITFDQDIKRVSVEDVRRSKIENPTLKRLSPSEENLIQTNIINKFETGKTKYFTEDDNFYEDFHEFQLRRNRLY